MRQLGHTGITVSPLCLGAMIFGAPGDPDHDESIRIIRGALDRIDEIVPPGTNLDAAGGGLQNPALDPAARRRPA